MITNRPLKIEAMGTYLPKMKTSSEIEAQFGIPQGWSEKYSGVQQRHHVTTESNGLMGAKAADSALKKAGLKLSDIDLLLCAGGTFDYPLPNQASIVKKEMKDGEKYEVPAIDLDATCLSFVAALDFASRMLGPQMQRILIVSTETASKGLNPSNWETTTLFGDGAAAAVVSYDPSGDSHVIHSLQKTYSKGVYEAMIRGGGNAYFFKDHPYDQELHSFHMAGKNLLRLAKKHVPKFLQEMYAEIPFSIEETDAIIPHQASKMGIHIFTSMYDFKPNQVKRSLERYGNCIAASIPLTLADCIASGEIKRGDTCLLSGTSAGFSIGGILIKY